MSRAFALLLGAWVVALAATLGALFIGEVLYHHAHAGAPLLFHSSRYRRMGDPL